MPISRTIARDRLAAIRRLTEAGGFAARLASRLPCHEPLPPSIPRDREDRPAAADRLALLAARGAALSVLAGERTVVPPDAFEGNVENFIGIVQVPAGVIGPLRIKGAFIAYAVDSFLDLQARWRRRPGTAGWRISGSIGTATSSTCCAISPPVTRPARTW
jgi:hypothetical protein